MVVFPFPVFRAESFSVSLVIFRSAITSLPLLVASLAVNTLLISFRVSNVFLLIAVAVARHAMASTVSYWYEAEFA